MFVDGAMSLCTYTRAKDIKTAMLVGGAMSLCIYNRAKDIRTAMLVGGAMSLSIYNRTEDIRTAMFVGGAMSFWVSFISLCSMPSGSWIPPISVSHSYHYQIFLFVPYSIKLGRACSSDVYTQRPKNKS